MAIRLVILATLLIGGCAGEGGYVEGPSSLGDFVLPTGETSQGATTHGRLSGKDGVRNNGAYADRYTITGSAGARLEVDLESSTIDCYLLLYDATGAVIAEDDDSGEGYLDSHFVVTLPTSGTYILVASSYSAEEGPYGLYVRRSAGSARYEPLPIPSVTTTAFDGPDLYNSNRSTWFRAWALDLEAGVEVTVDMASEDLDSLLILFDETGTQLVQDDDSGGSFNARLVYRPIRSGPHFLVATTYGYGPSSAIFELSVE